MHTFDYTKATELSAPQVFEALAKGLDIQYAEIETQDWQPLTQSSKLGFADFYGGFLKFRVPQNMQIFEKNVAKEKAAKSFSEFLNTDSAGNDRYRVGDQNPSFYILVKRATPHPLAKAGEDINYFDIFWEKAPGQLIPLSREKAKPWVINALCLAYKAKRRFEKNQALENSGFFASEEYRQHKKTHRI